MSRACSFAMIVAATLAHGCAGADAFRPGDSDAPRSAPNASRDPPPPPAARWEHADSLSAMSVLLDAVPSRGHDPGTLHARWLGNTIAAERMADLQRGDRFPAGAILVSEHSLRSRGTPAGWFAMIKREPGYFPDGGDWEWVSAGADRNVLARGRLEACSRCHADAMTDYVFPRPPRP